MSRSFRASYMGRPHQAIRGWYQGRQRECAKSARYKLTNMCDEEGIPEIIRHAGRKWLCGLGTRLWKQPDRDYEIIFRNGRKFMRLCKNNVSSLPYQKFFL